MVEINGKVLCLSLLVDSHVAGGYLESGRMKELACLLHALLLLLLLCCCCCCWESLELYLTLSDASGLSFSVPPHMAQLRTAGKGSAIMGTLQIHYTNPMNLVNTVSCPIRRKPRYDCGAFRVHGCMCHTTARSPLLAALFSCALMACFPA